jgi:hypothetical protein
VLARDLRLVGMGSEAAVVEQLAEVLTTVIGKLIVTLGQKLLPENLGNDVSRSCGRRLRR